MKEAAAAAKAQEEKDTAAKLKADTSESQAGYDSSHEKANGGVPPSNQGGLNATQGLKKPGVSKGERLILHNIEKTEHEKQVQKPCLYTDPKPAIPESHAWQGSS